MSRLRVPGLFRGILAVTLALTGASGAGAAESIADGVRTFHVDFTGKDAPDRLCVDFPIRLDLTRAAGVAFEFSCEDLQTFSHFTLYFKSGNGWYSAYFTPNVEGRVEHMRLPMRAIRGVEGEPAGMDRITGVRLSAWNGAPNKCVVTFGRLRALDASNAEALVLCADSCNKSGKPEPKSGFTEYAGKVVATIDALGLPVALASDLSLTADRLKGVRLVALPYNPSVPAAAAKVLSDWVASGGRLLICYETPEPFAAETGVTVRWPLYVGGKDGQPELGGFLRKGEGLRFQPAFSRQWSHCCRRVVPREGATVVAEWSDRRTGASLGLPAAVKTKNAVYLSHVWSGGAVCEPLELMRAILSSLVPEWESRFAEELAKKEAHRRAVAEEVRRMPPKPGERRLAWCHSPWGLGGAHDWDSSVRFLKENGFTDLVDNLAWGGTAYYDSKVLARATDAGTRDALGECLAACRKYGIRLHVWKVCWNPGGGRLPKDLRERYVREGRLQARLRGKAEEAWLCPSDPRNQQQEIDAMCELADRGVDGVHYDYIRYPGHDCCFCDGCRARFEKFVGRAVANWPADVRADETLAARWNDFRAGNISAVVGGVAKRLRVTHPKTEISAAVMRNAPQDRIAIGQDWGRWCREGWLDFACPMDYTGSPALFRGHIRRQKGQVAGAKLYPGIGLSCWQEDGGDVERFAEQLKILREEGVEGFIVFNFDRRAEAAFPVLRTGPFADVGTAANEPLRVALTFDDSLKDHLLIAAPMLEERGWRGTFNIVTDWIGRGDRAMTWDDVRELVRRGHEVTTHTKSHPNCVKLLKEGRADRVRDELVQSRDLIAEKTGFAPRFFCSPGVAQNDETERICRELGLRQMMRPRYNFGSNNADRVASTLNGLIGKGEKRADILHHGVSRADHGGWCSFVDRESFRRHLDAIAELERQGRIIVTDYDGMVSNCRLRAEKWPHHGVIGLSFDDRHFDQWEAALPLFAKYDARATFCVIGTNRIDFLRKAVSNGHEIASHGLYHSDVPPAVERKGEDRYWTTEMEPQLEVFRAAGIPVFSFAYPNGLRTPATDEMFFRRGFTRVRGSDKAFPNPNPYDPKGEKRDRWRPIATTDHMFVPATDFLTARSVRNVIMGECYHTDIEDVLRAVARAGTRAEALFLVSHGIAPNAHGISMKTEWLERLLAAADDAGVLIRGLR